MPDRMTRMWAPVNAGAAMGAAAVSRTDVTSILEVALGRDLRAWTVTRFVGHLQVWSAVTGQFSEWMWGMRVENENVPLGSIDPDADSTANWIFHGGIWTIISGPSPKDMITIDNRSQRKSQGEQSRLYFYMENTGGNAGEFRLIGRALMLLP